MKYWLIGLENPPDLYSKHFYTKNTNSVSTFLPFLCCTVMLISPSMFRAPRHSSRLCIRGDQKSWVSTRRHAALHVWCWFYIRSAHHICMWQRGLGVHPQGILLLWVEPLYDCHSPYLELWVLDCTTLRYLIHQFWCSINIQQNILMVL